jgi:hypothetical protein
MGTAFVPGRTFGVGEQQTYTIEQSVKLTVRFRKADDSLDVKNLVSKARRSVAFTVEGVSSAGNPVLGVATASETAPPASPKPLPYGAKPSPSPSPAASQSPPPSPDVRADGAVNLEGGLADLAPLAAVLAGVSADKLQTTANWRSDADLTLPLATLALHMNSNIKASDQDQASNVVSINSTGKVDVSGSPKVPSYGRTTLRGDGAAAIQAFVEKARGVMLGMQLTVGSRGNATSSRGDHGGYDLNVVYTVRLVRYLGGTPIASPGASPTVNMLSSFASPNSSIFSSGNPSPLAHPGPTNAFFLSSPSPGPSVTATPVPGESLPPIPIPEASDAPIATPPAPPSP